MCPPNQASIPTFHPRPTDQVPEMTWPLLRSERPVHLQTHSPNEHRPLLTESGQEHVQGPPPLRAYLPADRKTNHATAVEDFPQVPPHSKSRTSVSPPAVQIAQCGRVSCSHCQQADRSTLHWHIVAPRRQEGPSRAVGLTILGLWIAGKSVASWAERVLFLFLWRFWKSWESRLCFPLSGCLLPTGPRASREREWWCVIVHGFYRLGRSSHRIYSIPDPGA